VPRTIWLRLVAYRLDKEGVGDADTAWMIVSALYGVYEIALQTGTVDKLPQRFRVVWLMHLGSVGIGDARSLIDRAQARAADYLGS
jgi:hypothetical protein